MLVLGCSGHRRHGWKRDSGRKLASRLRHARRHPTLFDAVTSFGDEPEDLPLNLFPLDGVGHDSAAAILRSGIVSAAAAEERFARFKHATRPGGDTIPPRQSALFCLAHAGASIDDVDHIAFYCDFTQHALQQRIDAIRPHLSPALAERVFAAYRQVHEGTVSNERIEEEIEELFEGRPRAPLHFVPHHLAHAACAFYSSGYAESGILTIDGFGEKSSSIFAIGDKGGIRVFEETMLPGSLGVLYMMITAYLGFKPLDGEYKVMGLASYGNPEIHARSFEKLFEEEPDGTCRTTALVRDDFGEYINDLFGPPRKTQDPVTNRHMDVAAALQRCFEDTMLRRFAHLRTTYDIERICLAGGSALNVVMTGKLARSGLFKSTYVFPASGDDGASVGAAQYVHHQVLGDRVNSQEDSYHESRARLWRAGIDARADDVRREDFVPSRRQYRKRGRLQRSLAAKSSVGFAAAWNSARGRSVTEASSPILEHRRCAMSSTIASSTARSSGHSLRR